MKILYTLCLSALILTSFTCNKNDANAADNPYKVSSDDATYFKINIAGKDLVTYGLKFGLQSYEMLAFQYCYASIKTSTVGGQIQSDLILNVLPLYQNLFGIYGIKDGQVQVNFLDANKIGEALGTYKISGYNTISDVSLANKVYQIDESRSTLSVTSIDSKYIKGTFNLALINGSSIIMSPGTFSLLKF
jgi:hypothetical protein